MLLVLISYIVLNDWQRMVESIPKGEEEAGGASVSSSSFQGLQQADLQWERRRNSGTGGTPGSIVSILSTDLCGLFRAP